jgi:hypothetical protein
MIHKVERGQAATEELTTDSTEDTDQKLILVLSVSSVLSVVDS